MAAMAAPELKFFDVLHVGRAGVGVFKLTAEQLGWKRTDKGEDVVSFVGQDLREAEWQRGCGPGRVLLKLRFKQDSGVIRFAGFKAQDMASIQAHLSKYFAVSVKERKISTSGWSWGDWTVDEDGGEFRLCSSPDKSSSIIMEVPVADLSQVTIVGKQDLNLEFHKEENLDEGDEMLHEMRLFFPGGLGDSPGVSAQQARASLLAGATLSTTGQGIVRVQNVVLVAPRGKHSLEFFPQMIKLHGQTRTYNLKVSSVDRLFLCNLPGNDVALVLAIDTPLSPNQQPYLVFLMPKDVQASVEQLQDEQRKRYKLPLESDTMLQNELVARLFKELTGKPVIAPSTEFQALLRESAKGSSEEPVSCIRCHYKAVPGHLFPLKRSLIFLTKPVVWLSFKSISQFHFGVGLQRGRTFDLHVIEKTGVQYDFAQIDRSFLSPLFTFLEQTGVRIENAEEVRKTVRQVGSVASDGNPTRQAPVTNEADDGDEYNEEGDEDFDDEDSDGDEENSSSDEEEAAPRRSKRAKKA